MWAGLGQVLVSRRWAVLAGALVSVVLAGGVGRDAAAHLISGGLDDPGSEFVRADRFIQAHFPAGSPNVVLLVTAKHGTVDDVHVTRAGVELTNRLEHELGPAHAISYWSLAAPPLRSVDGRSALILVRIDGDVSDFIDRSEGVAKRYTGDDGVVSVRAGGFALLVSDVAKQLHEDLIRAELIAIPITLVLLFFVYRGVVAAILPVVVGGYAMIGTFLVLRILGEITAVSVFALNLTAAMGLGLGIDYSLFVVSRFREELAKGRTEHEAVVQAVTTAGRTVAISGLTVAASMSALAVFPVPFLRSFAYAGAAVAALAVFGAVVVLPALLAVLGHHVDWGSFRRARWSPESPRWARMAERVMRRPVVTTLAVVAALLLLGAPFLRIRLGLPDARVLPRSASSRQVWDMVGAQFSARETDALSLVAPNVGVPLARSADIDRYAAGLSLRGHVARVDALTGSYIRGRRVVPPGRATSLFASPRATWFRVVPTVPAISPEAQRLVKQIRQDRRVFKVLVTGPSAEVVDAKSMYFARLPIALGLVALTTLILLFLMFQSVLVPIKAMVLNLFSLTASFGALVWIFQWGHLAKPLGFTPTGSLYLAIPVLMFCTAFGVCMDYEIFILSRIKEEYDRTNDNTGSIVAGLVRSSRIVTAAAGVLSMVFLAFASSKVSFLKMLGVGMALAILIDAFVIRIALLPAVMRLAGRANWWAPHWLRRGPPSRRA